MCKGRVVDRRPVGRAGGGRVGSESLVFVGLFERQCQGREPEEESGEHAQQLGKHVRPTRWRQTITGPQDHTGEQKARSGLGDTNHTIKNDGGKHMNHTISFNIQLMPDVASLARIDPTGRVRLGRLALRTKRVPNPGNEAKRRCAKGAAGLS